MRLIIQERRASCYTKGMIILLTGKPGIGKSTALEAFLARGFSAPVRWTLTREIRDPETGARVGFRALNSAGEQRTISHKTAITSDAVIGEYRVDLEAVEAMFADALGAVAEGGLTVVDEIGPMQLLSQKFSAALEATMRSEADVIATIHASDERLARYREDPRHILLEVTAENRGMMPEVLSAIARQLPLFARLDARQREIVRTLVMQYVREARLVQLQKLMSHALPYVVDGNITELTPGRWRVAGRHGAHDVARGENGAYTCDCDLFNGRECYEGQAGECSHVQAAKISVTLLPIHTTATRDRTNPRLTSVELE